MDTDAAHRTARTAGWATLVMGAGLLAAPRSVRSGLADPRLARLLGAADLALVPGLLGGRPRWPWVAARAGLNVVQAGVLLARGRGAAARATVAALAALTVADVQAARTLRAAGR